MIRTEFCLFEINNCFVDLNKIRIFASSYCFRNTQTLSVVFVEVFIKGLKHTQIFTWFIMNIRTISCISLLLLLAILDSIVAKGGEKAVASEPQRSGGHISPAATNSNSSNDKEDRLYDQREVQSSNAQGRTRRINREKVPVIELSSDDEDVSSHHGGSSISGPHHDHVDMLPAEEVPRHVLSLEPLKYFNRPRPTAVSAKSPSTGSGPAQQSMPAVASFAFGTHHGRSQVESSTQQQLTTIHQHPVVSHKRVHGGEASTQGMQSIMPAAQQPHTQSRSDQRPTKVRRTHAHASASSSIPTNKIHVVPHTILNAQHHQQIVQPHTEAIGQSISNAIDLDSPTNSNGGVGSFSATGSGQHEQQIRPGASEQNIAEPHTQMSGFSGSSPTQAEIADAEKSINEYLKQWNAQINAESQQSEQHQQQQQAGSVGQTSGAKVMPEEAADTQPHQHKPIVTLGEGSDRGAEATD